MKKAIHAFAAAVLLCGPAYAAPTYLTCSLTATSKELGGKASELTGEVSTVELTLNEDQQTASYYFPDTGLTKRLGATFQRDVITFKEQENMPDVGAISTQNWSLDRVNGTLTRTWKMDSTVAPTNLATVVQAGPCQKAAAPERKF